MGGEGWMGWMGLIEWKGGKGRGLVARFGDEVS